MARRLVDEGRRRHPRIVDADLTADGDLVIRGVDWGPNVEKFFGRDEHEFAYTIRRDDLGAFAERAGLRPSKLLDDLADMWSGARFNELAVMLRESAPTRGFPVEFSSY